MVLRDQGNMTEALKYASRSYEVLGKVFGPEHERTQEAGEHIDHLHDLMDAAAEMNKPTTVSSARAANAELQRPDSSPLVIDERVQRNSIHL
jgi:hypothetical protein